MLSFFYAQESYLNLSDATFKVGRNARLDTIPTYIQCYVVTVIFPLTFTCAETVHNFGAGSSEETSSYPDPFPMA